MRCIILIAVLSLLAACGSEPPAGEQEQRRSERTLAFIADLVPVQDPQPLAAVPDTTAADTTEADTTAASATAPPVAHAVAQARLIGTRLVIEGAFSDLSGPPRPATDSEYDTGVHVHPGTIRQSLPHILELVVEMEADGRSGTFHGDFDLEPGKIDLLREGQMYVDIHTELHPEGEVRGKLRMVDEERLRGVARLDSNPPPTFPTI